MRILVVSDSHGDEFALRCAMEAQPKARMMIHLGDGERDMDTLIDILGEIKYVQLRGNGDFGVLSPLSRVEIVEGKRIYCTHGHVERVKYGSYELLQAANSAGAHIALYGHTHEPVTDYRDGLYIMNPGSIRNGDYGVVDITQAGIVCINIKL